MAVFLSLFGAKLITLHRFGSDLPYWDQWAGEGMLTFLPWLERQEFWGPLFGLHNEHRIAPTRALCLALMLVGGQWDARVQCIVNASLHATMVALLLWWASTRVSRGWLLVIAVVLTLLVGSPIAWENILAGFQSQFYFLIALSLLGIGGVVRNRAGSLPWVLAALACFTAVVSMGSGMLCGAPLIFLGLMQAAFHPERRRDAFAMLALGAAVLGMGAYLYVPAPHHAGLRSQSVAQFLLYFARCLSWPWYDWPWLSLVIWTPWSVLLFRWLKDLRSRRDATDDILLASGLWVLAQAAAVSYARGASGIYPSARYGDVTGLGVALGLIVMARLAQRHPLRWQLAAGVYLTLVLGAGALATRTVFANDLFRVKSDSLTYEANVRAFLLTDDESHLKPGAIPFPHASWLRDQLRNPRISSILPASVRTPLPLAGFLQSDPDRLPHRPIKLVPSGSRWQSAEIPGGSGWWKIETTGDLGRSDATLQLVSASSGAVLADIAPTKNAQTHWRAAYVKVPREPFHVVASSQSVAYFAFSQPVALSSVSYAAFCLSKQGILILSLGLLFFIPLLALLKNRQPSTHHNFQYEAPRGAASHSL